MNYSSDTNLYHHGAAAAAAVVAASATATATAATTDQLMHSSPTKPMEFVGGIDTEKIFPEELGAILASPTMTDQMEQMEISLCKMLLETETTTDESCEDTKIMFDADGSQDSISTTTTTVTTTSPSPASQQQEKYDFLYLSEIEHTLLSKVTTQVGSFQPLPSMSSSAANAQDSQGGMIKPKRFIAVLEARGPSEKDKDEFGHRRDTLPIADAIDQFVPKKEEEDGVHSAVFQFLEEEEDGHFNPASQSNLALKNYLREVAHGIVVRNNPGSLSRLSQKKFEDMLRELSDAGVMILSHPDVTSSLGAKDSLVKIRNLKSGLLDTEVYYDGVSFRQGFQQSIAYQPRVIKQNRGSQGEGVWIVKLKDESAYCGIYGECTVSLDTELVLMEAFDNHVEYRTVGEFMDFCIDGRTETNSEWTTTSNGKYFEGGLSAGAMVVDQRFLPRITEGEVRCLMVGPELVEIVHKKPKEGGLSATLQSGAIYTRYSPDDVKFSKLVNNFKDDLPHIMASFGMSDQPLPLIWTVDYIYGDTDDDLYAGEINCSCIGITQQLHVAFTIAKVAFETVFPDGC